MKGSQPLLSVVEGKDIEFLPALYAKSLPGETFPIRDKKFSLECHQRNAVLAHCFTEMSHDQAAHKGVLVDSSNKLSAFYMRQSTPQGVSLDLALVSRQTEWRAFSDGVARYTPFKEPEHVYSSNMFTDSSVVFLDTCSTTVSMVDHILPSMKLLKRSGSAVWGMTWLNSRDQPGPKWYQHVQDKELRQVMDHIGGGFCKEKGTIQEFMLAVIYRAFLHLSICADICYHNTACGVTCVIFMTGGLVMNVNPNELILDFWNKQAKTNRKTRSIMQEKVLKNILDRNCIYEVRDLDQWIPCTIAKELSNNQVSIVPHDKFPESLVHTTRRGHLTRIPPFTVPKASLRKMAGKKSNKKVPLKKSRVECLWRATNDSSPCWFGGVVLDTKKDRKQVHIKWDDEFTGYPKSEWVNTSTLRF